MRLEWLLEWYNLIFLLPFLLALLYVGIYSISGLTFGDADVHAGGDVDGDVDAHVDMDSDVDAHVDADAHFEADADAHLDGDVHADAHADGDGHVESGSLLASLLSMLGVGRVPLSIVLMVLMFMWGMIGLGSNVVLWEKFHNEMVLAAVSIPLAFFGSLIINKVFGAGLARWFPTHESYIHRKHELLGAVGEAILPIDGNFGMVSVRDANNDLFHIACRSSSDQPPLEKGTRVKLVAYNGKQKLYYVTKFDPAVASRTA